ncbi:MAG: hypothetical protein ACRD0A_04435 [Acidimicrobiales bacterium]
MLDVVEVDVDAVLLNPHSHRIRSLLESLPDGGASIGQNPFSAESQAQIGDLLRSTDGFANIRNALERDGQLHPGVITRAGVLVNANTRAVALRDLHEGTGPTYVKAVVLPADATEKEITLLELELQMERDVKQEYSFTARLLFIEELMTKLGMTALQVGQRLRPDLTNSKADQKKAKDEIDLELRLLAMVRQVLSHSAGSLKLRDFDGWRQGLIEIDSDYQGLRLTQPDVATRIREAQLAGLMAGVDYRRLRDVDSDLLDKYIVPALEDQATLSPFATELTAPQGVTAGTGAVSDPTGLDVLDHLDDESGGDTHETRALGQIYDLLAKAPEDGDVSLPAVEDGANVLLPRKTLAASLKSALETAISAKKRDNRQLDALTAPSIYLREAAKSLDEARVAWLEVKDRETFQSADFVAAAEEVRRAHDELDQVMGDD